MHAGHLCNFPYSTQALNPTNCQIFGFGLKRTQFVRILTESHSPKSVLSIRRSTGDSAQKFLTFQNLGHEFPESKNRT